MMPGAEACRRSDTCGSGHDDLIKTECLTFQAELEGYRCTGSYCDLLGTGRETDPLCANLIRASGHVENNEPSILSAQYAEPSARKKDLNLTERCTGRGVGNRTDDLAGLGLSRRGCGTKQGGDREASRQSA
jgi:hypothetical protein